MVLRKISFANIHVFFLSLNIYVYFLHLVSSKRILRCTMHINIMHARVHFISWCFHLLHVLIGSCNCNKFHGAQHYIMLCCL